MSSPFPLARARRSRLALAALLALGCGAAISQDASSAAPSLPARRIVIDPATGRPRMPDHEEFAAMQREAAARHAAIVASSAKAATSAAATARGASALASPAAHPSHPLLGQLQGQPVKTRFGALGRRVGADRLSFSVVRKGADGRPVTRCVAGEDAATHALHAGLVDGGKDAR